MTEKIVNMNNILDEYCEVFQHVYEKKVLSDFKSRIKAILTKVDILDWLQEAGEKDNPYKFAMEKFDEELMPILEYESSTKKSIKSAYKKLVFFVFGQYDANLYMSNSSDLEFCKLVAKNALFCTVEVAEQVKKGEIGSDENKKNNGNNYYSWFYCMWERGKKFQERRQEVLDPNGNPIKFNGESVKYDDNSKANTAIKNAIEKGLPYPLKMKFINYMTCHIWDETCYNNLFHTSVFNLVLLPRAIGGLSDHNEAVKKLLQYEAAWRFGVFPKDYNKTDLSEAPEYYEDVKDLWRQPTEHKKAIKNINEGKTPEGL